MRPTMRITSVLLFSIAVAAACSSRQPNQEAPQPNAPVLDHTFTIPVGEVVTVFLVGGATYRAEVNGTGIRLALTPVQSGTQAPVVEELVPGTSAGGTTLFTIRPRADGEYEFRTRGGNPATPVTVRLVREKST